MCQQSLHSLLLRRLLPASLDAKQGPWRSQAQSAVIILQCFPGSNGVPGSKDRAQGLRGRQGPGGAGEAQRLMTRLGDRSVAATAEGAGVSDPEAKEETAHSSQTGAGLFGALDFYSDPRILGNNVWNHINFGHLFLHCTCLNRSLEFSLPLSPHL